MMKEYTGYPWPGPNDEQVVTEMIQNSNSPHWKECCTFVSRLIDKANVPDDLKDEIVQAVMIAVMKGLRGFLYKSRLTTWLTKIVISKKIDVLRKYGRSDAETSLEVLQQVDNDVEAFGITALRVTEDECVTREELRAVIGELQNFARNRLHSDRDRAIISMVFSKQYTYNEVAEELNIDYQTVFYVAERARRHLRQAFQRKPPRSVS